MHLLLALVAPLVAQATSTTGLSIEQAVGRSSLIVHGTVQETENALSDDGDKAWTFVTLRLHETLRGDITRPKGVPPDQFTVRMPGGIYPDDTVGALLGTPLLAPGDEVVMLLRYATTGEPLLDPLMAGPESLYRIVRMPNDANRKSAVIDGLGRSIHSLGSRRGPVYGALFETARADLLNLEPVDRDRVAAQVSGWQAHLRAPEHTLVPGPWSGYAYASVEEPFDGTTVGCTAHVVGAFDGAQLEMKGSCNAQYVGALDLTVRARPELFPIAPLPPSSDEKILICHIPPGNPDAAHTLSIDAAALPAHLQHGDTLGSCQDGGGAGGQGEFDVQWTGTLRVESGSAGPRRVHQLEAFSSYFDGFRAYGAADVPGGDESTAHVLAYHSGRRPVSTADELLAWIRDTSERHPPESGVGPAISVTPIERFRNMTLLYQPMASE